MKKNDNNLFFTCSLIELIGRTARQRRKDVVNLMGEKIIGHIYRHADTLHCEPIVKTADYYINFCNIPMGDFDNVASCKYTVPTYWDIGKVYARLIEDIQADNVIDALLEVYNSTVSDDISYYNSDFFYQSRDFIKESFLETANKTAKKPAVRFSGFADAWEQRELESISSKVTEKNVSREYLETFTNSAEHGIISQRDYFDHDISNEENIGGYYVVRSEDFVYNPRISVTAPVGPVNRNKLRRNGVMSPLYTVFRPHDVDNTFLEYFFKSFYWHSYMNFNGDSGARSDRFSIKDAVFFQMPIPYPKLKEQQKIGQYLTALDDLITLHQRKYDKLVNVKKSMLEKLFPKNGSDVPEIRFSGFTDAWEQRKASDLFEASVDKNHPELPVLAATQEYGMVRREDNGINIYHDKRNEATYKRVLPGQFVIHLRSFQGGFAHSAFEGITSPAYTVFGFKEPKKHDDYFWKYIFHSDIFIKRLETVTYGIRDGRSISYDEFLTMQFLVPSCEEQKKIALYIGVLTDLITLHQRKLEKLKNLKKSCLEKMFV